MSTIELGQSVKTEIVKKIQHYFTEELQHEIGGFEVEFLLDFSPCRWVIIITIKVWQMH